MGGGASKQVPQLAVTDNPAIDKTRVKAVCSKEGVLPCTSYRKGLEGVFHCSGLCFQGGTVWGSGPFSADSCVCRAALHAGAIEKNGGTFRVTKTKGLDNYKGSESRGIVSYDYLKDASAIVVEPA